MPVQALLWHFEKGISMKEFLEDFPIVTKKQAIGVLEIDDKIVSSAVLERICCLATKPEEKNTNLNVH